ncbi:MAG TPA: hypothetical protein VNM72_05880 [Blastocatellia bacterium]|nr:hypothetical protein [Blastocatellia bacterium]
MNFVSTSAVEQSVEEAVQMLAALIKAQLELAALEGTASQVKTDPQVQRPLRNIRATQGRRRWA